MSAFVDLYDRAIEVRADDNCGRAEGGKFGPHNTCQEEGDGQDPASLHIKAITSSPIADAASKIESMLASESDKGTRLKAVMGLLDQAGYPSYTKRDMGAHAEAATDDAARKSVSVATAILLGASALSDEASKHGVHITSSKRMAERFGGTEANWSETVAFYTYVTDTVEINMDAVSKYQGLMGATINVRTDDGEASLPALCVQHMSHALTHEHGHMHHFRALKKIAVGDGSSYKDMDSAVEALQAIESAIKAVGDAGNKYLASNPGALKEAFSLSAAAVLSPVELMAEYYAKVRLTGQRTPGLDGFADAVSFPMDVLDRAEKLGKKVKL